MYAKLPPIWLECNFVCPFFCVNKSMLHTYNIHLPNNGKVML